MAVEGDRAPLRVAIVGCGVIGSRRADIASAAGDKVVMVVDIDGERARTVGERVGAAHTTRAAEALARRDIDTVVVATVNSSLAEVTSVALRSGKHVLCEKPFAVNAEQAHVVAELARHTRQVLKIGFNHRYHPGLARAHEIVARGTIGPVLAVRAAYGHGGRPGYEKEWRGDPALAGGGELLDQGIHLIDLSRWFLGDLTVVGGATATWVWPIQPLEDNAFALLRTANGHIASIHASWTQWRNLFRFEVLGEAGHLIVDGLGGSYGVETLTLGERRGVGEPPHETRWAFEGPDPSWRDEWTDFTSAIQDGTRPLGTIDDGVAAVEIVDALYAAAGDRSRPDSPTEAELG